MAPGRQAGQVPLKVEPGWLWAALAAGHSVAEPWESPQLLFPLLQERAAQWTLLTEGSAAAAGHTLKEGSASLTSHGLGPPAWKQSIAAVHTVTAGVVPQEGELAVEEPSEDMAVGVEPN